MTGIEPSDFEAFFLELHGREPFPWQSKLASRVCTSDWPDVIDLPTASGKTACIDIALFALACRERAPRRVFFVVDRKVIVDEAYLRMARIAASLKDANRGVLGRVADRLREMGGGNTDPLNVYQLRGGIYRDESWVRTPLQPTVVASTVDQVGSRLLFRGYGVTDSALPINAGLVGNDAVILLDEAHCSKAFAQTLESIQSYRNSEWAGRPVQAPFRFVEMTATPSRNSQQVPFSLLPEDREPRYLGRRLKAPKPMRFVPIDVKADNYEKLAKTLVKTARETAKADPAISRIAIMVNRVATARAVFAQLADANAVLLTGRMRPADREDVAARLAFLKSGEPRIATQEPVFVVSTQCLEVGADLDFDLLVTECASLDALLQRFGRLDRLGDFGRARGCIVAPALDPKKPDAVYGEALAASRSWLSELSSAGETELDFALEGSLDTVPQRWRQLNPEQRRTMIPPPRPAPALLPAHLDTLVQTSPRPVPEPDISFFLHGREPEDADVQVIWRADLDGAPPENWKDIVGLCPPIAAEALPVKLWVFKSWMDRRPEAGSQSDVEGASAPVERTRRVESNRAPATALLWRGERSRCITDSSEVRPGDTVVLPPSQGGLDVLGYVPAGSAADVADRAFLRARGRIRLRLHPELMKDWPETPSAAALKLCAAQPELDWTALRQAAAAYRAELTNTTPGDGPEWLRNGLEQIVAQPQKAFEALPYPDAEHPAWVLEGRRLIREIRLAEEDADSDERSAGAPISLDRHTADVCSAVARNSTLIPESDLGSAMRAAAEWHDSGKADPRFQALLHGGDAFAARFSPSLLAKGDFLPGSRLPWHWLRSGLPDGFRHELLSLRLAERVDSPADTRDLMLHLIATHHGRCRPFAPVVMDHGLDDVLMGEVSISREERLAKQPHELGSGVPDRFWRLTRLFGWWGLAYLEALFRLADWQASEDEQYGARKEGA